MTQIIFALAPVFLLIIAGYAIKRMGLVADAFWGPAERLTYYLFFPALLVHSIAAAEIEGGQVGPMAAALLGGVAAAAALAYRLRAVLKLDGPAFTSLYQGSFRPNTYVAIAAAAALFGDRGLALIALGIVVVVPTVNLISVLAMVRHASAPGGPSGWRRAVLGVAANPLILACLAGILINASGQGLPAVIGPLLETLGRAALPIALLAVGAGLSLGAAHKAVATVAAATAIKLAVLPLVVLVLTRAVGLEGMGAAICVMYASVPGSPSSYILARQMGGDGELMAGIITATTLAAMAAMPFWVIIAG
ncbi:MAG: AEC family transporter [Rhodospirillales bacterium]